MPKRGFRNFNQRGGQGLDTQAFMESNSAVARAAFIVLVLLVFIILMSFGVRVLQWYFSPSKNPKLVDGMKRADEKMTVYANPQRSEEGAKPILRSDDQRYGVEFTWSVWIYLSEWKSDDSGRRKHIFHKGAATMDDKGMAKYTQAPGLYLHETKNALVVKMNTFKGLGEEVVIDDIPLHKWLNVILRVEGNILDVYINGGIAVRHILADVVKQNYADTHINYGGGYDGLLSDLWYHNHALNTAEILKIVRDGPNLTMIADSPSSGLNVFPPYFSLRWYFGSTTSR
jgi:hypothetical protein